jgi:multidrug resistance efflux pump
VRVWFKSHRPLLVLSAVLIFLLLPLRHESASGRFVLEPSHRAVVRAEVPGVVEEVLVAEGAKVTAGQPLVRLRNLPLQSSAAEARAHYAVAADRAFAAQLHYESVGAAANDRDRLAKRVQQLERKARDLHIVSPVSGVVTTPRPVDRVGSFVTEGTELLEIADVRQLRARIYVSEYDMHKIREGAPAKVQVNGVARLWQSSVAAITPVAIAGDPTLADQTTLKGLHPPQFYVLDLPLSDDEGRLRPELTGLARVYGKRTSLARLGWESLRVVLGRKIW